MRLYERIMELAFTRLIFYPSNEVYGATAGFYDFGPVGILIKKKIIEEWRKTFIKKYGFYEVEGSIVTPEIVLKASGHVDEFTDPVVECQNCRAKIRADKLLEEKGITFEGLDDIKEKIKDVKCPRCGKPLGDNVYLINLMFPTNIGYDGLKAFLRPETAQSIFTSFIRNFRNLGGKLPLIIAQVGKSFRNEISPRQALVRLREFTQMEIEYFFDPEKQNDEVLYNEVKNKRFRIKLRGEDNPRFITVEKFKEKVMNNDAMAFFLAREWEFYTSLGLNPERMWFRHLSEEETPHYSKGNIDLEVETSYGIVEIAGNAYRTDYDLRRHQEFSKKSFEVNIGKKFIPHVVEASMGVERLFFCLLEHSYRPKTKEKEWEWFDLNPRIAPYEVAVYPLVKKDGLSDIGKSIAKSLREEFDVYYRETGSIGRRYAKADEIGVPYAITIDYQTKEDNTVTIRYRNDGKQERVSINNLVDKIKQNLKEGKRKVE